MRTSFDPELAAEVGLLEAIIVREIQASGNHLVRTAAEWLEALPFTRSSTLRKAIANLIAVELVQAERSRRTRVYRVNLLKLSSFSTSSASILPDSSNVKLPESSTVSNMSNVKLPDSSNEGLPHTCIKDVSSLRDTDNNNVSLSSDLDAVKTTTTTTEHVLASTPVLAQERESEGKQKRAKLGYSWEDYDWGEEVWDAIKRGEYPKRERPATILVGAYLLGMKQLHEERQAVMATEFNGKVGTNARRCHEYFTVMAENDAVAGLNAGLEYIRWYLTTKDDDFILQEGRNINFCFAISSYRDKYQKRTMGEKPRDWRKGALGANNVGMVTDEERPKRGGRRL